MHACVFLTLGNLVRKNQFQQSINAQKRKYQNCIKIVSKLYQCYFHIFSIDMDMEEKDHTCCFQVFKVLLLIALIGFSITTLISIVLFFQSWSDYASDYWPKSYIKENGAQFNQDEIEDSKNVEYSLIVAFLFINLLVTLISIYGVHTESFVITLTMALFSLSLLIMMVIDYFMFYVTPISVIGIIYTFFLTICLFSFAFNTKSWFQVNQVVPFYDYQSDDEKMMQKIQSNETPTSYYIQSVCNEKQLSHQLNGKIKRSNDEHFQPSTPSLDSQSKQKRCTRFDRHFRN